MTKINTSVFTLIGLFLLLSCSKDDNTAPLLGKWRVTESSYGGTNYTLSECDLLTTIEFFENGELIRTNMEGDFPCEGVPVPMHYKKHWNEITISYNSIAFKVRILTLNETTLKYERVNTDGNSGTSTWTYTRME